MKIFFRSLLVLSFFVFYFIITAGNASALVCHNYNGCPDVPPRSGNACSSLLPQTCTGLAPTCEAQGNTCATFSGGEYSCNDTTCNPTGACNSNFGGSCTITNTCGTTSGTYDCSGNCNATPATCTIACTTAADCSGGDSCNVASCSNGGTASASCNLTAVTPTNGTLSAWSNCSNTCGVGTQTRSCSGAACGGDSTCGAAALSQSCTDYTGCPTTYNCISGACTSVTDGTGQYTTSSSCTTNCSSGSSSGYDCVSNSCSAHTGGGSGTYSSLSSCSSSCNSSTGYDCVSGACSAHTGGGSGTYSSQSSCTASCTQSSGSGYDCISGACSAHTSSGSGSYPDSGSCNLACASSGGYDCSGSSCVAHTGSGSGQYSSSNCNSACTASTTGGTGQPCGTGNSCTNTGDFCINNVCTPNPQAPPGFCGDYIIQPQSETCDLGKFNGVADSGCDGSCHVAAVNASNHYSCQNNSCVLDASSSQSWTSCQNSGCGVGAQCTSNFAAQMDACNSSYTVTGYAATTACVNGSMTMCQETCQVHFGGPVAGCLPMGIECSSGSEYCSISSNCVQQTCYAGNTNNPQSVGTFLITLTPANQTISPGGSTSYTALVTPQNGYKGIVTLSAICPANTTCSFASGNTIDVSQCGASCVLPVNLTSTNSLAASVYNITVTGSDAAIPWTSSAPAQLTVSGSAQSGVCGTAKKNYAGGATTYGSDTFCAQGTASPSNPAFPAAGGVSNWQCLGSGGGASTTCTATRSAGTGTLPPSLYIDLPQPGVTISGNYTIAGWAIDNVTSVETAITSVKVSIDGAFIGNATYGSNRPDVCNAYPGRVGCPNVGWYFVWNTSTVSNGSHTITITATDSDPTPHSASASSAITVNNAAGSKLSYSPTSFSFGAAVGSIAASQTLIISNLSSATSNLTWSVSSGASWLTANRNLSGGTQNGTETPGGTATPPITVIANAASLSAGTYNSSINLTTNDPSHLSVTIPVTFVVTSATNPPAVYMDGPTNGSTVSGTVVIFGWALDNRNNIETGISQVAVNIDGTLVGYATYGTLRTDVCNVYPGRVGCPNVGWYYNWDTRALVNGSTHTIVVTATDTDTPTAHSATATATVTVNNTSTSSSLSYSPSSFTFSAASGNIAAGQTLTISNGSTATANLTWNVSTATTWLTANRNFSGQTQNGTESPGGSATPPITVTASAVGLSAGTYYGSITLNSNDPNNASVSIPVTLVVTTAPTCVNTTGNPGVNQMTGCVYSGTNLDSGGTYLGVTSGSPTASGNADNFVALPDYNIFSDNGTHVAGQTTNFSARWNGQFIFSGGSYTFQAGSDDGERIYIDGAKVWDAAWASGRGYTVDTFSSSISAGTHVITYEFNQGGGGAEYSILWNKQLTDVCTGPACGSCSGGVCGGCSSSCTSSNTVVAAQGICPAVGITLSWPVSSGASSYNVYRNTSNSVPGSIFATVTTNSFNDGVGAGGPYYYWVQAASGAITSPDKVAANTNNSSGIGPNICVPTPPGGGGACNQATCNPVPPGGGSNPSCGYVRLFWVDNSTNETVFRIYQDGSASPIATAPGSSPPSATGGLMSLDIATGLDTSPHVYSVSAANAVSQSASTTISSAGGFAAVACLPVMTGTDKDITAINGVVISYTHPSAYSIDGTPLACDGKTAPIPSSINLRSGDIVSFKINICNDSGFASTTGMTITDNLVNFKQPSNGWNIKYNGAALGPANGVSSYTTTINGTNATLFINLGSNKIGGATSGTGTRGNITFDAQLAPPAGYTAQSARFQNSFLYSSNSNAVNWSGSTPLLPFYTGGGSSSIIEVP